MALHLVSQVPCTLDIAHVEPALTEVSSLLIQELAAAQTAELRRLSGGESNRVIVEDEIVTGNVSGGGLSRIVKLDQNQINQIFLVSENMSNTEYMSRNVSGAVWSQIVKFNPMLNVLENVSNSEY